MESSVDLLPVAEDEFRAAFLWYLERNPVAARNFRDAGFSALESIRKQPDAWPVDERGYRRYVMRHFPYTIYYEALGQRIVVYAFAHQKRQPGYWIDR